MGKTCTSKLKGVTHNYPPLYLTPKLIMEKEASEWFYIWNWMKSDISERNIHLSKFRGGGD